MLISIVGTQVTNNLVDNFGVSLITTTVFFTAAFAATFSIWWAVEGTLSIHEVTTTRREAFYWLAILFTFALGTAAGDLVAEHFALGYMATGILFGTIVTSGIFLAAITALVIWMTVTRRGSDGDGVTAKEPNTQHNMPCPRPCSP